MSEEAVGVPPEGEPQEDGRAVTEAEAPEREGDRADLLAVIEEERALKEKYLAGWQRAQAEFENLKKQVARERAAERAQITEGLVRNMLPALDSLERAVKHARDLGASEAVTEGLDIVMRQFVQFLENEDIVPISARGEPYDPRRHEAILRVPTRDAEEGVIVQEIQRGYASRDRVIRPALVAVACRVEDETAPEPGDGSGEV